MKKLILLIVPVLCILLFSSCSNSENKNQITADNIVNSIETAIKQEGNSDEVVLSVGNNDITKQDFICFCKYNAVVADSSDYLTQEIIKETVKDIAFAKEAEQRKIQIPDEIRNEIENYTDEYVQNKYGDDYPLDAYKEIYKISYLSSEIALQIQEEIISGEISIDDKNTKDLYKKFITYSNDVSDKSKNWSDEEKLEEMPKFYEMYYDVENAYIDYLIVTHHLSV